MNVPWRASPATVADSATRAWNISSMEPKPALRSRNRLWWVTNPTLYTSSLSGMTQYQPSGEEMTLMPPPGVPGSNAPPR